MKFLAKRSVQIGIGVFLILILVGGGLFFFLGAKPKPQVNTTVNETQDEVVQKLSPEQLGLTMEASPDNKKVKFGVEKASDIKSMEYQITYEADSTAQEKSEGGDARVQRGITGQADVKGSKYSSDWLDLGSCSKNVCRYDTGVKSIQLTLKVVKKDGKTFEVEKTLEI